jgi:putative sugar O-methyltransferase
MSDPISNPIQRQLLSIQARGIGSSPEINAFWKRLVLAIDKLLKQHPEPTHAQIQNVLGYASRPLPAGFDGNRALLDHLNILDAMERHTIKDLKPQHGAHAAQLYFLKHKGLMPQYLAWADAKGLRSDLNLVRIWWYAERLKARLATLGRSRPQVILEIGAGAGRFPVTLFEHGLVSHYVVVDLPEMLLNSMITVAEELKVDIRLGETPDFSIARPTFWFLETADIARVAGASVDVALNINSLMEMDEQVRDDYLAHIDRVLRPGGLFYNVNRMQRAMDRRNGEPFESNPLTYPYKASDVVLEWEPDECQQSSRSSEMRTHPSFTISRMHLKAESPPLAALPPAAGGTTGPLQRLKRGLKVALGRA